MIVAMRRHNWRVSKRAKGSDYAEHMEDFCDRLCGSCDSAEVTIRRYGVLLWERAILLPSRSRNTRIMLSRLRQSRSFGHERGRNHIARKLYLSFRSKNRGAKSSPKDTGFKEQSRHSMKCSIHNSLPWTIWGTASLKAMDDCFHGS
jgi:hypothetical protein